MRRRFLRLNRKGQVVPLFAVGVAVLAAVATLTIDTGSLTWSRAQLQSAADAASMAGLLELWEQRAAGASEHTAREAAEDEAEAIAALNYPDAGVEVQFGAWDGTQFVEVDDTVAADACRVITTRDKDAPGGAQRTTFAAIVGINDVDQATDAVSTYEPARGKLIPFAVPDEEVGPVGSLITLYDDDKLTPGVFGLLDFNGGMNDANDILDWIVNGYQGPLHLDPATGTMTVEGDPGIKTVIKGVVQDHIDAGTVLIAAIHSTVTQNGAHTQFKVIGFVKLVIVDEVMKGSDKSITVKVLGAYRPLTTAVFGDIAHFMPPRLVQ